MRESVKDRSYRATPLGLEVARYYRWKKNEWGAAADTLRDYEPILAKLSLYFADLELEAFEPPVGTERIREAWDHYWGERTPRTRAKVLSVFRDFFSWTVREGRLHGNPALPISTPKKRDVSRGVFAPNEVERIIGAQARLRDRVALQLLFRLGIRKGELTKVQFKHYDGARCRLQVFGKGGKIRYIPVADAALRLDLERHILDRQADGEEFLLYPERLGPKTFGGPLELLWEDRRKPMSPTTAHRWWVGCLERAGVAHQRMHAARHTAITELVRHSGNLKLAQQLAGHAWIQTTADIYAHLDENDLAQALRSLSEARIVIDEGA